MISDILLVNDFGYVDGGASSVAVQTAVLLRRLGQNVTFVCGEGPICDELIEADVRVVCLNQQSINEGSRIAASVRGIWNRSTFNKMNVILKDYKPSETIVHIHTWTKVLSSSIFSAIKRSGFPMVLTAHDYFSICPNGGLYNYQTRAICKFRPMGIKCLLCN